MSAARVYRAALDAFLREYAFTCGHAEAGDVRMEGTALRCSICGRLVLRRADEARK